MDDEERKRQQRAALDRVEQWNLTRQGTRVVPIPADATGERLQMDRFGRTRDVIAADEETAAARSVPKASLSGSSKVGATDEDIFNAFMKNSRPDAKPDGKGDGMGDGTRKGDGMAGSSPKASAAYKRPPTAKELADWADAELAKQRAKNEAVDRQTPTVHDPQDTWLDEYMAKQRK